MEEVLKRLYTNPKNPSSYSSVQKLFNAARKELPLLTIEQVQEFLKTQPTYTLFKSVRRKFKRLRTIPSGLNTDWQADLMHFQSISRKNSGMKYLLVCVEVLSRFLYVEPVRSKKSSDMIEAFEKIFKRCSSLPWRLYSDSGLELCAKQMRDYFKKKTIQKIEAKTHPILHATMVERANRTIRDKMKRFFCENNTYRWVDSIQDLVHSINNSIHSTTKMTPANVNSKNAEELYHRLYGTVEKEEKPKFKVGDTVRVEQRRRFFTKKNQNTFTDQIFIIKKVLDSRKPVVYVLEDLQNAELEGYFYRQELCPVSLNTTFRIEKVLRSRLRNNKREYFVKLKGYNDSFNQWVFKEDLV